MTDALAHRGPDGEGFWQNEPGNVLFGHRRLAIIDLSEAAAQPMCRNYDNDPLTGLSIVYNGEIYNYLELRSALQQKGYHFQTASDTEVILAAYHCYGGACVTHFDGMFAFAIWDEEAQELFAARDRFGEKPFFYTLQQDALLFASEMKAFWAMGLPRLHNLKMLFNFITIGYTDNPARTEETFYTNISKLPPASCLYYTPGTGELAVEKYWDIDSREQVKKITENEAVEKFRHLFHASVSRRLRSDVTIGTSLSGGLDSSSIVAAVRSVAGQQPLTFSAVFPGFEKDESAYISLVTGQFGLKNIRTEPRAEDLAAQWQRLFYHQEEPFDSASLFAQFKVFELAKDHDLKVLLDGQGADETLAGYHKYYKWYWQELFQRRKLLRSGELKAAREAGITEPFGFRNIIASLFPEIASVVLEKRYLLHALRQEGLSRDFVDLQSKEAYYALPEIFDLNGALYFNTCMHGLEELLRYADRNSMAHGREVRLPFLDHELVEFLFTLPSSFKIKNSWTKWLLRQAMDQQLPSAITWRRDKTGYEPPQAQWMANPVIHDMIYQARKTLVHENILDPAILQKPIKEAAAYDKDNHDWRYLSAAAFLQAK